MQNSKSTQTVTGAFEAVLQTTISILRAKIERLEELHKEREGREKAENTLSLVIPKHGLN